MSVKIRDFHTAGYGRLHLEIGKTRFFHVGGVKSMRRNVGKCLSDCKTYLTGQYFTALFLTNFMINFRGYM